MHVLFLVLSVLRIFSFLSRVSYSKLLVSLCLMGHEEIERSYIKVDLFKSASPYPVYWDVKTSSFLSIAFRSVSSLIDWLQVQFYSNIVAYFRTPSSSLRIQLGRTTLEQRREELMLVQVHRSMIKDAPKYMQELFTKTSEHRQAQVSTRGHDNLHLPRLSTERALRKGFEQ